MQYLAAIDWGTSSLRGALLDANGLVLDERAFARGILTVKPGEFPAVFETHFGDWMARDGAVALVCGMAGSQQGWVEASYCECPAGFADVASQLCWIDPGRLAIVPGLRCEDHGVPDVLRGEETQIFGALKLQDVDAGVLVLPGTHSKWARVEGGRILGFSTLMTGEFYALLRKHSILARTLPADGGALDEPAFDAGFAHALRSRSIMQTAFSVRTLALFDRMPAAVLPSYLSGLVVGEELRVQDGLAAASAVIVVGDEGLTHRYQRGLAHLGIEAEAIGASSAWQGLFAIADALRL